PTLVGRSPFAANEITASLLTNTAVRLAALALSLMSSVLPVITNPFSRPARTAAGPATRAQSAVARAKRRDVCISGHDAGAGVAGVADERVHRGDNLLCGRPGVGDPALRRLRQGLARHLRESCPCAAPCGEGARGSPPARLSRRDVEQRAAERPRVLQEAAPQHLVGMWGPGAPTGEDALRQDGARRRDRVVALRRGGGQAAGRAPAGRLATGGVVRSGEGNLACAAARVARGRVARLHEGRMAGEQLAADGSERPQLRRLTGTVAPGVGERAKAELGTLRRQHERQTGRGAGVAG